MAARHPGLRVHQDRGVKADVVGILLHELLPPGVLDVLLELGAEGAVVPGVGKAAVDLAAGEDKAAVFAQRDDLVHRLFGVFHGEFLLSVLGSGDKKRPEPMDSRLRANKSLSVVPPEFPAGCGALRSLVTEGPARHFHRAAQKRRLFRSAGTCTGRPLS